MGQSVDDAKRWYNEGNIAAAKPVFEAEHRINPGNAQLNHWLGVIAFNDGEYQKALKHLELASQKNIPESYLYLARLYTMMYRFEDAEKEFASMREPTGETRRHLRRLPHTRSMQKAETADQPLRMFRSSTAWLFRNDLLSVYKLSASAGSLQPMSAFFEDQPNSNWFFFSMNGQQDLLSKEDAPVAAPLTMEAAG